MKAIDLFEKTIGRSKEMLKTHEGAYKTGRPEREGVAADLLRSIVVFSVASFDAYLHKKVVEVVGKIIGSEKRVPEKVINVIISQIKKQNGDEKDLTRVSRGLLEIAINKDPITRIKQLFEKGNSGKTFQKAEHVITVCRMMEIEDIWKKINTKISSSKKGPKTKGRKPDYSVFLDKFTERRDAIVHETDTYSSKKYHGDLRKITRTEVRDGIKKLEKIASAIEKISSSE